MKFNFFGTPKAFWVPVLVMSLFACDKEKEKEVEPGSCLITKVTMPGQQTSVITYDSQKRFVKSDIDMASGDDFYEEYEYNGIGKLSKMKMFSLDGVQLDYFSLEYNSAGLLTKESYFWRLDANSPYQHEFDRVYEYNANKQVVKVSTFEPEDTSTPGAQPDKYESFTYDASGNATKVMEYIKTNNGYQNIINIEYTYDQKVNPYYDQFYAGFSAQVVSKNNILTEKEANVLANQVKTYTFTYTYNGKGYPTKQTRTYNGNLKETNYEYSCN